MKRKQNFPVKSSFKRKNPFKQGGGHKGIYGTGRNYRLASRCTKCTSLLGRVGALPYELREMVAKYYKAGLNRRRRGGLKFR